MATTDCQKPELELCQIENAQAAGKLRRPGSLHVPSRILANLKNRGLRYTFVETMRAQANALREHLGIQPEVARTPDCGGNMCWISSPAMEMLVGLLQRVRFSEPAGGKGIDAHGLQPRVLSRRRFAESLPCRLRSGRRRRSLRSADNRGREMSRARRAAFRLRRAPQTGSRPLGSRNPRAAPRPSAPESTARPTRRRSPGRSKQARRRPAATIQKMCKRNFPRRMNERTSYASTLHGTHCFHRRRRTRRQNAG